MRPRRSRNPCTTPNGRSTTCISTEVAQIDTKPERRREESKVRMFVTRSCWLTVRFKGQSGALAIFRPTPPNYFVSAVRLDHTESKMSRHEYTLHYHGGIPGRGEFVRLAFEYTGTPYRVRFPSFPTSDLLTSLGSLG